MIKCSFGVISGVGNILCVLDFRKCSQLHLIRWPRSAKWFVGSIMFGNGIGLFLPLQDNNTQTYSPDRHGEDSFVWSDNLSGLFSVKSCYMGMLKSQLVSGDEILLQLKRLWKTKVPPKIQIFGWRRLINILPSKIELDKRGIFHSFIDLICVYCWTLQEDLYHLLISCSFASRVWDSIREWLELKHIMKPQPWIMHSNSILLWEIK